MFEVFRSISPKNDLIVYYRNLVLYFERVINCILRGIECYYEIPVSYTVYRTTYNSLADNA